MLNPELLEAAKQRAKKLGIPLSRYVDEALREKLSKPDVPLYDENDKKDNQ